MHKLKPPPSKAAAARIQPVQRDSYRPQYDERSVEDSGLGLLLKQPANQTAS